MRGLSKIMGGKVIAQWAPLQAVQSPVPRGPPSSISSDTGVQSQN